MAIASQKLDTLLNFDAEKLKRELLTLADENWSDHVNADVYHGEWRLLPLRALADHENANVILQANQIHSNGVWVNLPVLEKLPVINELLAQIQAPKKSVRLMKLGKGAKILPHRDNDLCIEKQAARLHIPILTAAEVQFYSDGKPLDMKVGELWYVNANLEHSVVNDSETERLHLVMDIQPNDWLMSQFDEASLITSQTAPTAQCLAELTKKLLQGEKDFVALMPVVKQMADIYSAWTDIVLDDDMNNWDDIDTGAGVAISPLQAAKCQVEPIRTQTFLLANQAAITDILASRLSSGEGYIEPIKILYAGTGPWGSILTPLLPGLKKVPVHVTCLDIHPENVTALQKVLQQLDVEDRVTIHCADATKWCPPEDHRFDLLISETMSGFLCREPQVTIFSHLQQFLKPDGKLIPENIRTSIWMGEPASVFDAEKIGSFEDKSGLPFKLADLLHLNRETAAAIHRGEQEPLNFEFELPEVQGIIDRFYQVTDIIVYKEHYLDLQQSSLCTASARMHFQGGSGDIVKYRYVINEAPVWEVQLPDYFAKQPVLQADEKSEKGLVYLPRLWSKYRLMSTPHYDAQGLQKEFEQDVAFCNFFEIPCFNIMNFMTNGYPTLQEFEDWFSRQANSYEQIKIEEANKLFMSV